MHTLMRSSLLPIPRLLNVEVESAFDRLLPNLPRFQGAMNTPMDLLDTEDALQFVLEVPGVDRGDIQVLFENDVLTIKGEKKNPGVNEEDMARRERVFGSFERRIQIRTPVDVDKIDARLENGILTVRVPKAAEARARKIEVKS